MDRRLFSERNYDVKGRILSLENYQPFKDRKQGLTFNEGHRERTLKLADEVLTREHPVLLATDFMMFKRDGNRSIYQAKYFLRRDSIIKLAFAEATERKGRYIDKLAEVLWMILEETTWVLPAHNPSKPDLICPLPYAYTGKVDYIDLFSATTSATLSWVYHLCKNELDSVTPLLNERLLFEINRRIIDPFTDSSCYNKMGWMGFKGNYPNNWNPWIVSNVLDTCAFTVTDTAVRENVVKLAMDMLDNFTAGYHDDGGCDEGPSYWGAAGASLFDCCESLFDISNGYINIYDDDLLRKMGEYEVKVCINGNRFLNFADSPSRVNPDPMLLARWGEVCNSEMMRTYGYSRLNGNLPATSVNHSHPYRFFKNMVEEVRPVEEFVAPVKFWLDGIIIAGTRESTVTDKGFYLAIKGGHNAESHNHNDLGNIVVFYDGKPIFLDAGSGTYTRRTFSAERYTIWAMRSDYHNCATINGVTQEKGKVFRTEDHVYDEKTGGLNMSLKNAYPPEADIASYTRGAVLENGFVTVTDEISLNNDGEVMFSFICNVLPEKLTDTTFVINERTISFDTSLSYNVEELDKTWPEVAGIPKGWDADVLHRVTLKSKEKFKDKKFILTIK